MRLRTICVLAGVAWAVLTPTGIAQAAGPPPLSADRAPAVIDSSYGSGDFGHWLVDRFGLPAFRYAIDESTSPMAKQPEVAGATRAQHQVGNDNIKGMAWNDG